MILYSSEPFWSGDALIAIALLIGIVLGACLPAAVCFRAGEKGTGAGCLALGLLGTFLYIPWIIAVVMAAKRVSFQEREETAAFRNVGRILGILMLGLGVIMLALALRSISDVSGNPFAGFYMNIIANGLIGSGYICVLGLVTLLCAFRSGKGFWGCYMALPFLMSYGISSAGRYGAFWRFAVFILLFAGGLYIWYQIFISVQTEGGSEAGGSAAAAGLSGLAASVQKAVRTIQTKQPGQPDQPVPGQSRQESRPAAPGPVPAARRAIGRIRCISGQYAGAEFPMKDGEVLCFGSDPKLAHLIFGPELAAPLHMEITYQKERGNYLLAHRKECQVFLPNLRPVREEISEIPAGTEVSFGNPQQVFRVL